ncbi:hypothetical protein GCM10022402_18850 [Salinactinospora qingdaonensis]|uniref:Uncharacterized protein n=1 Tax=Salinactinospora qingdaonensis TaxID=702744 RepID=A0ABP7FM03_9ACTN
MRPSLVTLSSDLRVAALAFTRYVRDVSGECPGACALGAGRRYTPERWVLVTHASGSSTHSPNPAW